MEARVTQVALRTRMALAIFLLFGLLFAFFMGVLYYFYYVGTIPPSWLLILSVSLALGVVLLQWGISPYIIKWIYKIEWIGEDAPYLDPRVARAIEAVRKHTSESGVRMPRFGIVPDDNPNAFTFGWTRNRAFVVLTRGVFKYCEDEEVEAVAAHEVGHIVHNDFIVMTVVAAVVLLFYVIFRGAITFMRMGGRSRDSGKAAAAALVVAVVSFIVYILANYIGLLISRYREYWADDYSAEQTRDPNALSSALVKIAYGLATEGQGHDAKARSKDLSHHSSSLGIFNISNARALAVQASTADGTVSKDAIKETMAWDLWNPWAFFMELGMTHPLPAKRITTLDKKAEEMGQTPYVKFDLVKPESYWDDFLKDVLMKYSWLLAFVIAIAIWYVFDLTGMALGTSVLVAFCLAIFLAGLFGSIYLITYRYPMRFKEARVQDLLRDPKASPVRGIPVTLRGRVIGRGVPGLFFSEDLKIDDGTGLLLIDYRSIARLIDFFQGVFATQRFVGQEVEVIGWYRRYVTPMLELRELHAPGMSRRVYRQWLEIGLAVAVMVIGAILLGLSITWAM